jgi:hypothetical protein
MNGIAAAISSFQSKKSLANPFLSRHQTGSKRLTENAVG